VIGALPVLPDHYGIGRQLTHPAYPVGQVVFDGLGARLVRNGLQTANSAHLARLGNLDNVRDHPDLAGKVQRPGCQQQTEAETAQAACALR
jgi:hypothetical protein